MMGHTVSTGTTPPLLLHLLLLLLLVPSSSAATYTQPWLYVPVDGRGPGAWSTQDATCGGAEQSPIDIREAVIDNFLPIQYFYAASNNWEVENLQAFTRVNFLGGSGGYILDPSLGRKRFNVKWFEIHTPSEHAIEGGLYDLEIQVVHEEADASVQPASAAGFSKYTRLTTSILFKSGGGRNAFLDRFLTSIPNTPITPEALYSTPNAQFTSRTTRGVNALTMNEALPEPWSPGRSSSKEREYFVYDGSMTSPVWNCSEGVRWVVYAHPVAVAAAQLQEIRQKQSLDAERAEAEKRGFKVDNCEVFGNNRPTMPLGSRLVRMYSLSGIAEEGSVRGASDPTVQTTAATCTGEIQKPWLYADAFARGPERWGTITDGVSNNLLYPTCSAGTNQAPIDLSTGDVTDVDSNLKPLNFQYSTADGYRIVNDGSTQKITFPTPIGFIIDPNLAGKRFELSHVLFRSPSEHSIGGGHYAMEMQLVHHEATGQTQGIGGTSIKKVGVSVLFQVGGADNSFLANFWGYLQPPPRTPDNTIRDPYKAFVPVQSPPITGALDLLTALPASKVDFFTYDGSDTTPPCTEGTRWYVYTTPTAISQGQLDAFVNAMNFTGELQLARSQNFNPPRCSLFGNNRPTQPRNSRVVKRTSTTTATPGRQSSAHSTVSTCTDQPWLYTEVLHRGPSNWSTIVDSHSRIPIFPMCGSGVEQSPITIDEATLDPNLVPPVYKYASALQYVVENTQSLIRIRFDPSPGTLEDKNLGGRRFELKTLEFHSPSEHAIGDGLRKMEMHMVHDALPRDQQPSTGQAFARYNRLVVAVLFDVTTADNKWLAKVWGQLQALPLTPAELYGDGYRNFKERRSPPQTASLDITGVFPKIQDFFTYDGSVTAPPCTEGVKWYVYSTPVGISTAQLNAFRTKMGFDDELLEAAKYGFQADSCELFGNNRPTQRLESRMVKMYSSTGAAFEGTTQGATGTPAPESTLGTTITSSSNGLVQIVDPKGSPSGGSCGQSSLSYKPWTYAEANGRGPSKWGEITAQSGGSPIFPVCASGAKQAPINVTTVVEDKNLQSLSYLYNTVCDYLVENNQKTIVLKVNQAKWHSGAKRGVNPLAEPPDQTPSPLTCEDVRSFGVVEDPNLGNKRFELMHLEFHAPSEHAIYGKHHDMEMQLFHEETIGQPSSADPFSTTTRLAIGVFFKVGQKDSPFLDKFWEILQGTPVPPGELYNNPWRPFTPRSVPHKTAPLNPTEIFPTLSDFITYDGSVTSPPCTEGMQWYVYTTPVEISQRQLDLFRQKMGFDSELQTAKGLGFAPSKCATFGNNRPTQPQNGRVVRIKGTLDRNVHRGTVTSAHGDDLKCLQAPWLYSEVANRGPSQWGQLRDEAGTSALYPLCSASSLEQSPVDISSAVLDAGLRDLEYNYPPLTNYAIENNQRNGRVVVENEDGSKGFVTDPNLGNKRFDLLNLHFHAPSEHAVNGALYDMEMHIVHRESGAGLQPPTAASAAKYRDVVVTVLFEVTSTDNPWLAKFWDRLQDPPLTSDVLYNSPYHGFHPRTLEGQTSPLDLLSSLPSNREFFTYDGSFTEPPCREGVKWYVYRTPMGISASQLEKYRARLNITGDMSEANKRGYYAKQCHTYGNNRPVQPLNNRVIKMRSETGITAEGDVKSATASGGHTNSPSTGQCTEQPKQQPWLYTPTNSRGPSDWGTVKSTTGISLYPQCATGKQQAPVNMEGAAIDATLKELLFRYSKVNSFVFANVQSAVKLQFESGELGAVEDPNLAGKRFELVAITFRTPSEHTVGGGHFDMEMQLWHKEATGQPPGAQQHAGTKYLGIAILFKTGADNAWLNTVWQRMPATPLQPETLYRNKYSTFNANVQGIVANLDVTGILPTNREYFLYEGSMTAPPCTEGTRWYVYSTPQQVSSAQLGVLRGKLNLANELTAAEQQGFKPEPCTTFGNIRPAQPLQGRTIKMRSSTGLAETGSIRGATDPPTLNSGATAATCTSGGGTQPWYYSDVNARGPKDWGSVRGNDGTALYPTCGTGIRQSPVDLGNANVDPSLQEPKYVYQSTGTTNPFTLANTQDAIRMTFSSSPGYLEDPNQGGKRYSLQHIIFRAPSEHPVRGGHYPMEAQLVHYEAPGQPSLQGVSTSFKRVIVSIFFSEGRDNAWLNTFWLRLPARPLKPDDHFTNPLRAFSPSSSPSLTTTLDLNGIFPPAGRRTVYSYDGSLTAPPCTEGVRHYVYATSVSMRKEQIDLIVGRLGAQAELQAASKYGFQPRDPLLFGNIRPSQPLNGRVVRVSAADSTPPSGPLTPTPPTSATPPPQGGTTPPGTPPVTVSPTDFVSATVIVPGMSMTGLTQQNIDAMTAAATRDLARAYGLSTDTDRIATSLVPDPATGGLAVRHTTNLGGLGNPEIVRTNIHNAYADGILAMPELEQAYLDATGRRVPATIDFTRSGPAGGGGTGSSSATVVLPQISISGLTSQQVQQLTTAAGKDLSNTYGVTADRIFTSMQEDTQSGGVVLPHSVSTQGLSNERDVINTISRSFSEKRHTFPILEELYRQMTGRQVTAKPDYARSVLQITTLPPTGSELRLEGKVFRMLLRIPVSSFDPGAFVRAASSLLQPYALKLKMLFLCPGTVCPGFTCARTYSFFIANGCSPSSQQRLLEPLQAGSDMTYLEFDMEEDSSFSPPSGMSLNQRRSAGYNALLQGMAQSSGVLSPFTPQQLEFVNPVVDDRGFTPQPSPTTVRRFVPSAADDDSITDQWWFWLIIALAILCFLVLLGLLIYYCCCRGKKRKGDKRGKAAKSLDQTYGKELSKDYYSSVHSRAGSDEGLSVESGDYPPGCPVDVNYNGEWQPARVDHKDDDGSYVIDWGDEGITRGVHPGDMRPRTEGTFATGDRVLCWYVDQWHPAVISGKNSDGTYDVNWGDGTGSKGLVAGEIRLDHQAHGVIPILDPDYSSPNRHLVNKLVDVYWNGEWSRGTVRAANADGSVLIQWPDQTYSDGVDPTLVRPVE